MPLMFAGSNYFVFKKEAIDFILTDPVVKLFLEWSKDTLTPGSNMKAYKSHKSEKFCISYFHSFASLISNMTFDSQVILYFTREHCFVHFWYYCEDSSDQSLFEIFSVRVQKFINRYSSLYLAKIKKLPSFSVICSKWQFLSFQASFSQNLRKR